MDAVASILAPWWPLGPGTTLVLGLVGGLLVAGTVERGVRALTGSDPDVIRVRLLSLAAWWVLFALFVGLVLLGPRVVLVAAAALSIFLLRDTLRLADRLAWYPVAAVGAVVAFLLVWRDPEGWLTRGLPLVGAALLAGEALWRLRRTESDEPARTRSRRGREPVVPALLIGVSGPVYLAGVARLQPVGEQSPEALGWFVLLVVLTELNDSAQAWWGRAVGRHRMTPVLSPRKTWEGLVGGVATTAVVALAIAPLVTPYGRRSPFEGAVPLPDWSWAVVVGVGLGLAGAAGDLLGSWLKRRAGVKDSGDLIPGQGGLLDRADSLTLTAPFFYLVTLILWF